MRILAILVLVFGVALAGGAIFFASKYFDDLKASMAQDNSTVRVLVVKKAMNYGATIKPENLHWVEWPKGAVPPGAFTSVEALLGKKGDQRRIVLRTIEPGEPVLESKITKAGESPRMAMNLSDGMRAVSIRIDEVSGVAGFVAAGDRVDILLIRSLNGELVSSVILHDVTVIAVDQTQNVETASAKIGRTVTVEVDTRDAQKLALAQQVGQLSLTLRGMNEGEGENFTPVTASELSGITKQEEDPAFKVRVRRAGSLSNVQVAPPDQQGGQPSSGSQSGQPAPQANTGN
jgi:pilus assembly protein CpaB